MIKHEFIKDEGILIIEPTASLQSGDFDLLSNLVDPYVAQHSKLAGLVIRTVSFPGWEDLASLLSHIKFVKKHHAVISKVAIVADEGIVVVLPTIADRFVSAEVRHFGYDDVEDALEWIGQD